MVIKFLLDQINIKKWNNMDSTIIELADKLIKYVDECSIELSRDMVIHSNDSKDGFLIQASLSLFNIGMEQTKAVAICSKEGYASAARTCLRALMELTLDVRLMLEYGNSHENAVRFLCLGSLELKKMLQKDSSDNIEFIKSIDKDLKEYRELFPIAITEIENNFSSNIHKHWSGLSYKQRLSKIKGGTFDGLNTVYGILSWDAHGRLAYHRSKFNVKDGRLTIKSVEDEDSSYFDKIINSAGIIFNSLSSAIFSSPFISEKPRT
jgi:hypothetical protein